MKLKNLLLLAFLNCLLLIPAHAEFDINQDFQKTVDGEVFHCKYLINGTFAAGLKNKKGIFVSYPSKIFQLRKKLRKLRKKGKKRKVRKTKKKIKFFKAKIDPGKQACAFFFSVDVADTDVIIQKHAEDYIVTGDSYLYKVNESNDIVPFFTGDFNPAVLGFRYFKLHDELIVNFKEPTNIKYGFTDPNGCLSAWINVKNNTLACASFLNGVVFAPKSEDQFHSDSNVSIYQHRNCSYIYNKNMSRSVFKYCGDFQFSKITFPEPVSNLHVFVHGEVLGFAGQKVYLYDQGNIDTLDLSGIGTHIEDIRGLGDSNVYFKTFNGTWQLYRIDDNLSLQLIASDTSINTSDNPLLLDCASSPSAPLCPNFFYQPIPNRLPMALAQTSNYLFYFSDPLIFHELPFDSINVNIENIQGVIYAKDGNKHYFTYNSSDLDQLSSYILIQPGLTLSINGNMVSNNRINKVYGLLTIHKAIGPPQKVIGYFDIAHSTFHIALEDASMVHQWTLIN